MDLEEKKVGIKDIFLNPRKKEWWYTGFLDSKRQVYFSLVFIRSPLISKFRFNVFDSNRTSPSIYHKTLSFDKSQQTGKLDLKKRTNDFIISYSGDEQDGWRFELQDGDISANVKMEPRQKSFTKFDDYVVNDYNVLLLMNNKADGKVKFGNRIYDIKNGQGIYDHCFGKVPRKTRWHWLAVQNRRFSLASWVNHDKLSQKYSIISLNGKKNLSWKLDHNVSFECINDQNSRDWKATSSDMNLNIKIIMSSDYSEKIPAIFPFLVNLNHNEHFIEVKGKVRIGGKWTSTGKLYGVMEDHFGKW